MSKQHARLLNGLSWCESTAGSHFFTCSISVSANIAAFHAAAAGAAPAWSAEFSWLPRCKSPAHRPAKAEDRGASPRGSTISHGDHDVTAASGPVKAVVRVRIPLVTPISMDPKLRQRSIRLLTGRAGRTSLRVHQHSAAMRPRQQPTNRTPLPCPTPPSLPQPQ